METTFLNLTRLIVLDYYVFYSINSGNRSPTQTRFGSLIGIPS
jgi:hypothetical protein